MMSLRYIEIGSSSLSTGNGNEGDVGVRNTSTLGVIETKLRIKKKN